LGKNLHERRCGADGSEVALLKEQIQKLSIGRDKLTQELDLQVEETDRLTIENAALTQVIR
jgi:regulator of replication initiation timing